mmetsp:Transcript_9198/g.20499  ORF Transcript_9198/g.20499 Transcript_9198/m.20499 type:complete len:580 (+) Transcript_9198:244-1983(+)
MDTATPGNPEKTSLSLMTETGVMKQVASATTADASELKCTPQGTDRPLLGQCCQKVTAAASCDDGRPLIGQLQAAREGKPAGKTQVAAMAAAKGGVKKPVASAARARAQGPFCNPHGPGHKLGPAAADIDNHAACVKIPCAPAGQLEASLHASFTSPSQELRKVVNEEAPAGGFAGPDGFEVCSKDQMPKLPAVCFVEDAANAEKTASLESLMAESGATGQIGSALAANSKAAGEAAPPGSTLHPQTASAQTGGLTGLGCWAISSEAKMLGINCGASLCEASHAFKRKSLQLHPDRGGTAQKFKAILAAYHAVVDAHAEPLAAKESVRRLVQHHGQTCRSPDAKVRLPGRLGHCAIERVVRSGGQVHYRVSEHLEALHVTMRTQYVTSLEVAIQMSMVLVQTAATMHRRCKAVATAALLRVASSAGAVVDFEGVQSPSTLARIDTTCDEVGLQDLDTCFVENLATSCEQQHLRPKDIKVSFSARVWCPALKEAIDGQRTSSLAEALKQRNELLLMSKSEWPVWRSWLISVRQLPTKRRLSAMAEDKAAAQIDKLYVKVNTSPKKSRRISASIFQDGLMS